MTQRAVWIVCLFAIVLSIASVAYRLAAPSHFDAAAWRDADAPEEYLDRRAMLPDLRRMFADGTLGDKDSIQRQLGPAERTEGGNTCLYNLGGQRSASAPDSASYLELTFDEAGHLKSNRITQEMIVPPR